MTTFTMLAAVGAMAALFALGYFAGLEDGAAPLLARVESEQRDADRAQARADAWLIIAEACLTRGDRRGL